VLTLRKTAGKISLPIHRRQEILSNEFQIKVEQTIRVFLVSKGHFVGKLDASSNLVADLGLESDEGLDLALEFEDVLGIQIPSDVNPIINEKKNRGSTVGELVSTLQSFVTHGS
jgi:acyl carrier protein